MFKDHFSRQAGRYARYRPNYPPELFDYLASLAPSREAAWDCGTGNGQAAVALAQHFTRVIASDASEEQLSHAFPHERITYRLAPAEEPGIEAASIDLVTVAQALHWFDLERFYEQVRRVLRPRGVLAAWTYTMCRISPEVDRIVDSFYSDTVGPYWPKERKLVDDEYRTIPFPFDEVEPPAFSIALHWTLEDLLGYLRTWSPTRIYIEKEGRDPVEMVEGPLKGAWGEEPGTAKPVEWPLHMRVGR